MKKYLLFIVIMLCTLCSLYGQQPSIHKIKGTVKDASNDHLLAGTTLILKKSQTTVITSAEGLFSITLSNPYDTLIATHIGYQTQRIAVGRNDTILFSIYLQPTTARLQEVVVSTGYQKIPQERATGSFEFIDNDALNMQVGENILDRLNGVASGILFDTKRVSSAGQKKVNLSVRGLSSIEGPKDPLIILDNFPYEGDISNINPNNIESITVLKDAAAASIWGTKAGNGVIVITTKRGKFNQPFKINFNSYLTITEEPNLFNIPQISPSDFIDVEQFLFNNGYRFPDTSNLTRPPFSPVYEILFKERNGIMTKEEATNKIKLLRSHDVRNDFLNYMYQKGIHKQYFLNFQGGSEKISNFFSIGYNKNLGVLHDKNSHINLRTRNKLIPLKGLELDIGMAYSYSKNVAGRPGYNEIHTSHGSIPPYTQFTDKNGNPLPVIKDFRQPYLDTAGSGKLLDWNYYPIEDYKYIDNTNKTTDFLLNFDINYSIIDDLMVGLRYQYEKQLTNSKILHEEQSYFTRNIINRFSQLNREDGDVTYIVPLGGILDMADGTMEHQAARLQLSYNKAWNRQSISLIAGAEIRQTHNKSNSNRTYGYDDNILTFSDVDYTNIYPTFIKGWPAFIPNKNGFSDKLYRFVSAYSNLAYVYNNKYTISASVRRDGSNIFGVNTNNKWQPLWSTGLSWNISREHFFNVNFIPYLKLKATYGYSGNVDQGQPAVTTLHYGQNSPYTNQPMSRFSGFENPDLKWEKVGMINFGIDFRFINDRVTGSIDYYRKMASDLLARVPLDLTVGLGRTSIERNVGELQTWGWDVKINSLNINKIIKWNTSLILNINKNKLKTYYFTATPSFIVQQIGIAGIIGNPVYGIYSYKWGGLDPETGNPRGFLKGQLSDDYASIMGEGTTIDDLIFNGTDVPTLFGSLRNSIKWRGFSLTTLISYRLNYYFRKESINYNTLFYTGMGNSDYELRWQNPGDEKITNVPSMIYPDNGKRDQFYTYSDILVRNAGNIRLRFIKLSYELTKSKIKKLPFERISIYSNLSNLGAIWTLNKENIDPDYPGIKPLKHMTIGLRITL